MFSSNSSAPYLSFENTMTSTTDFGSFLSPASSPRVVDWPVERVVEWVQNQQFAADYSTMFRDHNVSGDVLPHLTHIDLEEMGIKSIGHRLRMIKAIRELGEFCERNDAKTTSFINGGSDKRFEPKVADPVSRSELIHSLAIRDERMALAETEVKKLIEGYGRLREDLMPIFRQAKESKPLPTPEVMAMANMNSSGTGGPMTSSLGSSINNHSGSSSSPTSGFNQTPFWGSPSTTNGQLPHQHPLISLSSHVSSTNNINTNTNNINNTSTNNNPSGFNLIFPPGQSQSSLNNSSGSFKRSKLAAAASTGSLRSPTNSNSDWHDQTSRLLNKKPSQLGLASSAASLSTLSTVNTSLSSSPSPSPSTGSSLAEAFKSFRIKEEDPCYKVLPAALRKYRVNADPRNYVLVVCYDDQERLLGPEEKPLLVFKELQDAGRKPVFMLRMLTSQGVSTPGGVL